MKIAIAGYGVEGEENYKYWSTNPANELTIVDERSETGKPLPAGAFSILGEGAFAQLNDFDLVIRTAGLALYKLTTTATVWSATNEFFAQCPAQIIGVTGSKGKGTTASLIASMLEAAGKKVWLVGNIGVPALGVLSQVQPDDIVVYELSSFQLWDLQRSPHTAVVLFIEQEHLDVHRSMEEYVEAKAQITRHQQSSDTLIYNADNDHARHIADASVAQKIGYPSDSHAHIKDEAFYYGEQRICAVTSLSLPGVHNKQNALAAIDAVWGYTNDVVAIEAGLHAFKGLAHRLAYVATVDGVDYYDDSIATTPASAIAALRTFAGKPMVIILGGSSKGADFTELAKEMTQHSVRAILIGDEAQAIAAACDANGFVSYEILENATAQLFTQMAAEVFAQRPEEVAKTGGVVLLSPASASFGLFKNYVDRGDQFIAAVKSLYTNK